MMFKWPGLPSPNAPGYELADFAELTCWRDSQTSATSLTRLLGRLDENDYSRGVPEEDEVHGLVEEAYLEIERRQDVCGDGYPFVVERQGSILRSMDDEANFKHVIYKYLLLATRLNMRDSRNHADLDGTQLLELLASEVARGYLGCRAESFVFGTSASGVGFKDKIQELCDKLNEGGGFVNRGGGAAYARDDKLDVVVWKPFSDGLPGKLIGFGQCKTGTHFRDSMAVLQPDKFGNYREF